MAAENAIERLAIKLQRLPPEVRWLYAQQSLVQAQALQTKPVRGWRSACVDRLAVIAIRLKRARVLAVVVMGVLLLVLYVRQRLTPVKSTKTRVLFIGIGALREPELMRLFEEGQGCQALHIDERTLHDFYRFGRIGFLALFREMRTVWREVGNHLHPTSNRELRNEHLLTFFMLQGSEYTFLRAWFRHLLDRGHISPIVACSSASFVSFAVTAAGAKVVYMQHGFQRHSLVYPEFAQAICLTSFEAAQLQRRLPDCAVTLVPEQPQQMETSRALVVSGARLLSLETADLIRPVIQWAMRNDVPVTVRPHPLDDTGYWDRWRGVKGVEIVGTEESFSSFLDDIRPRYLACWYSTALFDALLRGIVPMTVAAEGDQIADVVFPLRGISLHWPKDKELAQTFLDNTEMRAAFIAEKWSYIENGHAGSPPSDNEPIFQTAQAT